MVLSKNAHSLRWGRSRKSLPSQKLKRGCPSPSGGWDSVHRPAAQSHRLYSLVLEAGAQGAGVAPFWGGPASWCARDPLSLRSLMLRQGPTLMTQSPPSPVTLRHGVQRELGETDIESVTGAVWSVREEDSLLLAGHACGGAARLPAGVGQKSVFGRHGRVSQNCALYTPGGC